MSHDSANTKVALITGAARRIGAEIARTLHAAGMNVALHYHNAEAEATALSLELNQRRKHSAITVCGNLVEAESEKYIVQQAVAAWGRLDVLINNASQFYQTPFGQVTEYAWQDLMNCNVKAPFFLAQAAALQLSTNAGVIVNIVDIHADRPMQHYAAYCISKSALVMMTKVLAKELGPNVRVNAIAPGSILWPEGDNALSMAEQQKIIAKTLLQRSGGASDIAKAVLYFVRDADYVTGQVLTVDGGRLLSG